VLIRNTVNTFKLFSLLTLQRVEHHRFTSDRRFQTR